MGLSGLNAALSGLRISNQQINVISNNISNATTPGFSRKILPQSAQIVNGVGVGVLGEQILRNVDLNLTRDLWTQISSVEALNVQRTYLGRVEQFHGPPDQEISVAADVARLEDSFAALSDAPEDGFLLNATLNQAVDTANKINDLADLVNVLRNDAQNDISQTVTRINQILVQIEALNQQVSANNGSSRPTAFIEDQRDQAIQELSSLIEITSFTRGDGVLVVQTNRGEELVGTTARTLTFNNRPVGPGSFHPDGGIDGVFVNSFSQNISAVDLTDLSPGGRLGGLLELRDVTLPKQTAQVDELAHKLALRLDAQGLRLFTNSAGAIPPDTAPDPTQIPVATGAVSYVGFASQIQVNENILEDNSLLRRGTDGAIVQDGSNAVINRVLDFALGVNEFQTAQGGVLNTIDLRSSLQPAPNNTLQNLLGLQSTNRFAGTADLTTYTGVADIIAQGGDDVFGQAGLNETDRFILTFDDPDLPGGPINIDIDLRTVVPSGVNAAQDLVNAISGDVDFAAAQTAFGASVSIGSNGQLVIESRSDVTIDTAALDPISATGFAFLGLAPGTSEAIDPSFEVAVGNNAPTTITIEPGDTEVELIAKLNTVPGLAVEDIALRDGTLVPDGVLRLRPGNDFFNPDFGGSITITGGPFETNSAGIGAATIPDGVNIVSALFGSFSAGPPIQDSSPITDVPHGSETNGSLIPPIPTTGFRNSLLGAEVNISTGISGALTLESYAQSIVNENAQEIIQLDNRESDEVSLRDLLQTQLTNESGVNIDEELSTLILIQTAYAASARVITAVDQLFDDLLNAVR